MNAEAQPFSDLSDAELRATLLRALRLVAILAVAGASLLLFVAGWQTAMLLVAGALVSASGVWEWQKLITLINAKMDNAEAPGMGRIVAGFFLRLGLAGAVLYGSLRCFHGSVYALVGGLALAVFALVVEALRLLRR